MSKTKLLQGKAVKIKSHSENHSTQDEIETAVLKSQIESLRHLNDKLEKKITEKEEALHESELRFESLMCSATDFIYYTDIHGNFTFVNEVAAEMFGYKKNEVIGHHFTEFIAEESMNEVYSFYKEMIIDGKDQTYNEFQIKKTDGVRVWIGQNVKVALDSKGMKYFSAVARDITEKKSYEEQLKRNEEVYRIINNFSTSLLGSNSIEEILWDITYNCVAKMNFEDCVVFLFNNERTALVQRAAYGSDKEKDYSIEDPMIIQTGKGIVGNVALTGLSEIINDVSKDKRYIPQDQVLQSELAVPIIYEGEVIGVIDSEHSKKNFYQDHHLEVLNMIASLAANKLMRTVSIQRQKESEKKYRGIIEQMDMGIVEVDTRDIIIKAYPRFCKLVGYEMDELVGQSHKELLFVKKYVPILEKQNKDRIQGKSGVYEVQLKRKDGTKIWVIISGTPLYDHNGHLSGTIGIHYDISPQKALQDQLEKAKKKAEKAQNAEKQFLANMSHEIRTPLNAIVGMSFLLEDTNLDNTQKEYLGILHSSADLLLNLISDILDISKIDAGSIDIQESAIDLIDLISVIQKSFFMKLQSIGVEFLVESDPEITTLLISDKLLLNQILLNLTSNAAKFTQKGHVAIRIKKGIVKKDIATIHFEVEDTGIGIPEEDLPKIFDQFKQVRHKSGKKYRGTGLGLAITKKLIELQGGHIRVESKFNQGTCFYFDLPMQVTSTKIYKHEHSKSRIIAKYQNTDVRLLIVEDNPMNQKYVCTLLEKWNLSFDLAENGLKAVEKAQENHYDLIFMDLQMPEMDGFEATEIIKKQGLNQETAIVALSASTFLSKKKLALETGMTDFLTKPFTPNQLVEMLDMYLTNVSVKSEEENDLENYSFSQCLDREILSNTYDGDIDYALEIFEMFMQNVEAEKASLDVAIKSCAFEDIKAQSHRMKPTFGMVGLTSIQEIFAQIEQHAKEESLEDIRNLITEVTPKIEQGLLQVNEEMIKMKSYLNPN